MDKERFLELHKQYCLNTGFLSYTDRTCADYQELLSAGEEIIPWLLERLQASIGHDRGDSYDGSNSPWLSTHLLGEITNNACLSDFPRKHAGKLDKIRSHILKWGETR